MFGATLTSKPSAAGAARTGRPPRIAVADIIDVALTLFGTRGLRGTSIGAIAERLGITDSGVLHYFPTKDALVAAVVEEAALRQTNEMQALVAPGGLEAIRRMAVWGTIVQQTPELTALQIILSSEAILEESTIGSAVRHRYAAVHDLAAGLIRDGIERGEINASVNVEWEASAVIAYLDGIRLQWFYSGHTLPIADAVRRYFDLLIERLTIGVA
jgi:AcrR family transcriptional regulator